MTITGSFVRLHVHALRKDLDDVPMQKKEDTLNASNIQQMLVLYFFLNNQLDILITQIYSVIKLYMFRAFSLPTIGSSLLYIRQW
jgi:hypothetical protein